MYFSIGFRRNLFQMFLVFYVALIIRREVYERIVIFLIHLLNISMKLETYFESYQVSKAFVSYLNWYLII